MRRTEPLERRRLLPVRRNASVWHSLEEQPCLCPKGLAVTVRREPGALARGTVPIERVCAIRADHKRGLIEVEVPSGWVQGLVCPEPRVTLIASPRDNGRRVWAALLALVR